MGGACCQQARKVLVVMMGSACLIMHLLLPPQPALPVPRPRHLACTLTLSAFHVALTCIVQVRRLVERLMGLQRPEREHWLRSPVSMQKGCRWAAGLREGLEGRCGC
jgi:hypothetical protein